nr:uncharacterized protein LOC118681754 [Bactrocera oleae]
MLWRLGSYFLVLVVFIHLFWCIEINLNCDSGNCTTTAWLIDCLRRSCKLEDYILMRLTQLRHSFNLQVCRYITIVQGDTKAFFSNADKMPCHDGKVWHCAILKYLNFEHR